MMRVSGDLRWPNVYYVHIQGVQKYNFEFGGHWPMWIKVTGLSPNKEFGFDWFGLVHLTQACQFSQ